MQNRERESLVTRQSIALSLAPPRAPPYDSVHRNLLLGQDHSESAGLSHETHHHDGHHHHNIRERLAQIYQRYHLSAKIPHPHLPAGPEVSDQITRALGVILPVPWHNRFRDSGSFRSTVDGLVSVSAPTIGLTSPSAAINFINLSLKSKRIRYGSHKMHVIDMLLPDDKDGTRGLIFFVHGGAWGSGLPWMYRLAALPFLEMNLAVAIVGYRTYPDADVCGQVDDLEKAANELTRRYAHLFDLPKNRPGHIGTCVMGHSSGAHIGLLMVVDHVRRKIEAATIGSSDINSGQQSTKMNMDIDVFVGLSGPYDISHHFDYEAARGVEELSPMKAANGYSREKFKENSPAVRLQRLLATFSESKAMSLGNFFPQTLLMHGVEDSTVPFTATSEAAHIVRSCGVTKCDEIYLAQTAHQDVVMHLMLGGRARENVVRWLDDLSSEINKRSGSQLVASSRL
eukprot:CAMPEP_0195301100 /NCGR_PEP_ID=MMETSP0707-20130614/28697_1 /TAXON_ID=33640 /ORGANISM="Asterionellopsis glacialis, Strain CCMP134" /LENGTH=455 /DNA_ID=CAMNT_0040363955 /DNA_START=37 /DNA_END=1404 /DNA_ORIENTATION=+